MNRRVIFLAIAISNISYADSNFYVDLKGGYDFSIQNSTVSSNSNPLAFKGDEIPGVYEFQNVTWKNNFEGGFDAAAAFGFQFDHWRWDFEFLFQNIQRDIDGDADFVQLADGGGAVVAPIDVDFPHSENRVWIYSLLLNGYYDFRINAKWHPFVGGGIGAAWVNSESTVESGKMLLNNTPINIIEKSPTISSVPFAWQLKGGLTYLVNEHLYVEAQYRLFGTTHLSSGSSTITASPNTARPTPFYVEGQPVKGLLLNAIELGLRYVF